MIVDNLDPKDREIIPQEFGVIFIDCWEFDWEWEGSTGFYQGLKQRLSQFNVASKVFHTTCIKLDSLKLDVINYFRQFILDHPKQAENFKTLLDNAGDQVLDPELWELVDQRAIFIPTVDTFEEHVVKSGVQHWIVVGCHWGICMHTKPLGFNNLRRLRKKHPMINFYTIPECVARWKWTMREQVAIPTAWQDLHDDDLRWSKYHHGLARLETSDSNMHRPQVKIVTDRFDMIKNHQGWEITTTESAASLKSGLLPGRPGSLQKSLRDYHVQEQGKGYVLFVVADDVEIDMRDLLCSIDNQHSLFLDPGFRYALYRHDAKFQSRFL